MSESVNTSAGINGVSHRSGRITGAGRLVIVAFALVGVAIGFVLIGPERTEPFLLGLLGLLAVVGVFTLFAGAVGLIRFSGRDRGDELSRPFLDAMSEGVVITHRDGRVIYANPAYADLMGATPSRPVGSIERALSDTTAGAEAVYRIVQALSEREAAEEEIRISGTIGSQPGTADTEAHWYRVTARPLGSGAEEKDLYAWTVADISRERARQETVFQELQHAIDYLDHAPAGFFSAEPDGRVVYLNATLAGWLGIDLAQFDAEALTLSDIVRSDGVALLAASLSSGTRNQTEVVDLDLVKRNGQNLPVRLLHRVPVTADGAPGATRTVVLNRSPGEETSEALRASEVRFARFFNNTPMAIAALDKEGRIGRTNGSFLRLFEQAKSGHGGGFGKLVDLFVENERPKVSMALQAAAGSDGIMPPVDAAILGKEERSVRLYFNRINDSGAEEAVIVNAFEITEQRTLEMQFAQSQKMQAVGQLAGGIAHDFNNVLTAIIGFSDLLLANHRPSDPSFQDIMNIKQNANRAAGLVRQLLAFSRRQTLRPEVLVLGDVLSDLSILLERLLGENVKLDLVHGSDLWPVKADLNQLEQVIINLAVNGRDAMPAGGTMTIRTRNLPAAEVSSFHYKPLPRVDYALIELEDTGTGMSPEVQAQIFEPFFSTKEVGKGTGLGLSTVYGIVKQTGGHIYFTSEVGKGTVFRVFLPRHMSETKEEVAGSGDSRAELTDLTGSASILLVEDEEAVRAFAARALTSRGYKVYEAPSGVEALEVMEESGGEIDLVVSDVVMPELDGPSLLKELRKTRPDLKIIFVSGYAEDAFKKNLPPGESFQFLPKPFSLKQLAVAVKETLGR